jgi:hypothetical protein
VVLKRREMPSFLNIGQQSLIGSARSENLENVRFLDEVFASLKIMTLMMSRMMPIPDAAAKLASTEYSVEDIMLGGPIITRLYYNQIYGRPPGFQYDIDKLRIVAATFDIPWEEPV